jgi:hypothetical protein
MLQRCDTALQRVSEMGAIVIRIPSASENKISGPHDDRTTNYDSVASG